MYVVDRLCCDQSLSDVVGSVVTDDKLGVGSVVDIGAAVGTDVDTAVGTASP